MPIKDKVVEILNILNGLRDNQAVLQDAEFLSFIVSLLPLPVVQQAGQVANRIVNNHTLNLRFKDVKTEILAVNSKIQGLETQLEKVAAITNTVAGVTKITEKVKDFVEELIAQINAEGSEFVMDTSNWSVQAIIKQILEVDFASITAKHHSQNILKDTKLKAKKTHLQAHDHSINIVDGTDFQGEKGSIGMQGMGQTGKVEIRDSSIGFFGNSSLIFGARPETVSGTCPLCSARIIVEKQKLIGYFQVQCPNCKKVMPFRIN